MSTVFFPVYKDTYYESYSTSLAYYITTDGQIIFEGKALRGPSGKLRININRILKDYIENTIADFREVDGEVLPQPEAFKIFELRNENNGELLATYGVLFDWEGEWNGESTVLSDPIRKRISPAMKFPISVYSPSGETIILSSGKITHSTYFHNLTPAIVFAYTGGTAQIFFDTDFEPISSISVSATTSGYTFSNITPTSVTVTAASNTSAEDRSGDIIFLFDGNDLGWGRTYVDTLRSGSTPVTGITWLSGDTVHRDCWSTVPFEEELRVPFSFGQGVMTADFSGAECGQQPSPYFFSGNTDWVHFYYDSWWEYHSGGYLINKWGVNLTCDTNSGETEREALIITYKNNEPIMETRLVQSATIGGSIEPTGNTYPYEFIEIGPFPVTATTQLDRLANGLTLRYAPLLSANQVYPDGSITFNVPLTDYDGNFKHPIISKKYTTETRTDGKYFKLYTKVPVGILSGDFSGATYNVTSTSDGRLIVNLPSTLKAVVDLKVTSATTFNYEGTKNDWKKLYKNNITASFTGTTQARELKRRGMVVNCTDGQCGLYAQHIYTEKGSSGVCSDCGYTYEYPRNAGNPNSVNVVYMAPNSGYASELVFYDEDYLQLTPIAHTFEDGVGTLTFARPPYRLLKSGGFYGINGITYLSSESIRILDSYSGVPAVDVYVEYINLPLLTLSYYGNHLLLDNRDGGPASATFNNLEFGNFTIYGDDAALIAPNIRSVNIGIPGGHKARLFLPSAQNIYFGQNSYNAKELTIGPTLRTLTVYGNNTLPYLTEINFNSPSTDFYTWYNAYGSGIISKMPNLTVIHTFDADITVNH